MKDGNIIVCVTGSGELSGDDKVVTKSKGKIYTKNNARYIVYEVADPDNRHIIIRHLLTISGGTLKMSKSCKLTSAYDGKILYDPKHVTESDYATPYGVLKLSFETKFLKIEEDDNSYNLTLKYNILMGSDVLSRNKLEIKTSPDM